MVWNPTLDMMWIYSAISPNQGAIINTVKFLIVAASLIEATPQTVKN